MKNVPYTIRIINHTLDVKLIDAPSKMGAARQVAEIVGMMLSITRGVKCVEQDVDPDKPNMKMVFHVNGKFHSSIEAFPK